MLQIEEEESPGGDQIMAAEAEPQRLTWSKFRSKVAEFPRLAFGKLGA